MSAFDPSLICTRMMPHSSTTRWVRLTDPPSGHMSLDVQDIDPLVSVGEIVVSETYWRHLTADEIHELPEDQQDDPAQHVVQDTRVVVRGHGAQSVPVEPDQDVDIELVCEHTSGDGAEEWHVGRLVAHLSGPATSELPLYFAIGGDGVEPHVSEEQLSVWLDPGQERNPSFSIDSAPSGADVRACLIGGERTIRSSEILVEKEQQLTYQQALHLGLLDGMTEDELDVVRENGFSRTVQIAHATGSDPVRVSSGNQVRVNVACRAPENGGGVERAHVALVAPQWKPVTVPVTAVVQSVSVSLDKDRFTLARAARAGLDVTVSSGLGTAGYVMFELWGGGDVVSLPPPAPLVYGPQAKVRTWIPMSVSPTAPLGPADLRLVALFSAAGAEDALTTTLDFHVTVVPSATEVRVSPTVIGVPTGSSGLLTVAVLSGGGSKEVELTPGPLPPGVRMESATLSLGPTDTEVQRVLRIDVDPDNARLVSGQPVEIRWKAGHGQSGTAVFRLTVLQRPESRTFSQPIITPAGVPLAGRAEFVINSDGSARFKGFMRATGLFSYKFTVRAVLQSRSRAVAVIHQKSGRVYGTDTPGPRQLDWDEPADAQVIADMWPDFRGGSIAASRSSDMIGLVGGGAELVGDVLEFAVANALLLPFGPAGQCLAGLSFVGSEIGDIADAPIIGPGGLAGVLVAGGVAFLVSPALVIPAFIGGALIGEALVGHRPLEPPERAEAERVFGDTLPWDRIRLTNMSGPGGSPVTLPSYDGTILVNLGDGFDSPLNWTLPPTVWPFTSKPGQTLIHELTHAWQIAHKSFKLEYFWKGAVDLFRAFTSAAVGGDLYTAYRYGPAGEPWRHYGLEEQASIVDEWWAGTTDRSSGQFPPGATRPGKSEQDPYFRYISENLRMDEPL
ncbi:hypothetical protein [Kitasatospora terrestris]|uniref:Uncharacterized protein n=1 Tax=Kitasatospora terrestris TaxID=258051 RepID=A0ABP9D993_9ACTN